MLYPLYIWPWRADFILYPSSLILATSAVVVGVAERMKAKG
jgi:hypothetical protein